MEKRLDITPLTVGWIPYWNLHPMKYEIARLAGDAISFRSGHPIEINKMLTEQKVELAPASSVCLLTRPLQDIALPLGVVSDDYVHSVYLGLSNDISHLGSIIKERMETLGEITRHALCKYTDRTRQASNFIWNEVEELKPLDFDFAPRLKLSSQSASSVALAKIFYRMIFGRAHFESQMNSGFSGNSGYGTMELIIGDDALVRRSEFSKVIDLGHFWHKLTNLPFVFAVWQKSKNAHIPEQWQRLLHEAAEIAEARMKVEHSFYLNKEIPLKQSGTEIDLLSYWQSIHYRLGPKEMRGLMLFLCLARSVMKVKMDDAMVIKMLRWQEIGQESVRVNY